MKSVKLELKKDAMQGIVDCINELVRLSDQFDYTNQERLSICVLYELSQKLAKKLVEPKKVYRFKLSATYAISLRVLYNDFMAPVPGNYINNVLLQISNMVHQQLY